MDGDDGQKGVHETEDTLLFFFSSLHFFLRFTKIGPSKFVGPRTKNALRDEGYAWVPKTRDFTENSSKSLENPNF